LVPILVSLLILSTPFAVVARLFTIVNQCPESITLFINGESQGSLNARDGTTTRNFPRTWSGFIYTSANGGNQNGTGTTRAGFFGDNDYYYLVIDPNYLNTGVSISVNTPAHDGFCVPASCTTPGCTTAFNTPPTRFPPPASTPPNPPLYACLGETVEYTIRFCPGQTFPPPANAVTIHPNGNTGKCLDVRGAVYANGTPVQIYDCNQSGAQKWLINNANTHVRVAGTPFCLDAGSTPGNGVGMKIWQCYDNLPAQEWFYTADRRIALTGRGLCLDLTNGGLGNGNQVQTWACTDFNTNQIWTV